MSIKNKNTILKGLGLLALVCLLLVVVMYIISYCNIRSIAPPHYFTFRSTTQKELQSVASNQEYLQRGDYIIQPTNPEYSKIMKWINTPRIWLPVLYRYGISQGIYSEQCVISKNGDYIYIMVKKGGTIQQYSCKSDNEINEIFNRLKSESNRNINSTNNNNKNGN